MSRVGAFLLGVRESSSDVTTNLDHAPHLWGAYETGRSIGQKVRRIR